MSDDLQLSDTYRTLYPTSSFKITEDSMDSGSSGSSPIVAVSVMQFLTYAQRCFCTPAPQLHTWLQTLLVLKTSEWGLKIVQLHLMTFTSLDISDQEILQLCQLPILRSHCATALSTGRRSLQQMIDIWADVLPKEQLKRYLEMGRKDTRGSNRKLPQMERP